MTRFAWIFPVLFLLCTWTILFAEEKESVVKIYVVYNEHNYHEPWQMKGIGSRHGSGVIIQGKRILTNAHVVCDNTFLQVRKSGQAKRYTAVVDMIDHKSDLALLKVNDPDFFKGIVPLKFGHFSHIKDEVYAYGFPEGGDKLSITKGVVSRVEHKKYKHAGSYLIACQLDAPLNRGNSGGPIFKNEKIVGIAFQNYSGTQVENIGYMIPMPVIRHFLKDIADNNHLDGIPEFGISMQKFENQDMRAFYQMRDIQSGVLVNAIYPDSPAIGYLEVNDVLLKIDDFNIDNDGTIEFRKGERTYLGFIIQQKQINESVRLNILRNGKDLSVELPLTKALHCCRLVSYRQYKTEPEFYIIGGLVFEALAMNYLYEYGGSDFHLNAPTELLNLFYTGVPSKNQKDIVMLAQVLPDDVNIGYHEFINGIISKVNGKNIAVLEDLITAFESWDGDYHVVEDIRGFKIVLNRTAVEKSNKRILEKYKIFSDRSLKFRSSP